MLVLSRSIGQRILIGDDIEILICDVKSKKVTVGVIAPKNMLILREELSKEKRHEMDGF
ncbi:MAG: carbon storage regulator [Candidatus Heimdallarchaeaceae archaeon]